MVAFSPTPPFPLTAAARLGQSKLILFFSRHQRRSALSRRPRPRPRYRHRLCPRLSRAYGGEVGSGVGTGGGG